MSGWCRSVRRRQWRKMWGAKTDTRKRGDQRQRTERHVSQGGGKFTRAAPKVRRARRRQANACAKQARKCNRSRKASR